MVYTVFWTYPAPGTFEVIQGWALCKGWELWQLFTSQVKPSRGDPVYPGRGASIMCFAFANAGKIQQASNQ